MIQRAVRAIRASYREDVPIIVRMDAGFLDQEIFEWCEAEQVGYICGSFTRTSRRLPPALRRTSGVALSAPDRCGSTSSGRTGAVAGSTFGGRSSVGRFMRAAKC